MCLHCVCPMPVQCLWFLGACLTLSPSRSLTHVHPHDVDGSYLVPAIHQIPVCRVKEVSPSSHRRTCHFTLKTRSRRRSTQSGPQGDPSCDHVCYVMSHVREFEVIEALKAQSFEVAETSRDLAIFGVLEIVSI